MLLLNKTAVITGCNRGIGKKILEVFSANGATIFACVRNITEEFKSNIKLFIPLALLGSFLRSTILVYLGDKLLEYIPKIL